jgi:hypothetical protein
MNITRRIGRAIVLLLSSASVECFTISHSCEEMGLNSLSYEGSVSFCIITEWKAMKLQIPIWERNGRSLFNDHTKNFNRIVNLFVGFVLLSRTENSRAHCLISCHYDQLVWNEANIMFNSLTLPNNKQIKENVKEIGRCVNMDNIK